MMLTVAGSSVLLSGCSSSSTTSDDESSSIVKTLSVSTDQVVLITDFTELTYTDQVTQESSYDLPMGCILYMDATRHSAVIMPSDDSRTLVKFGFLDIDTGDVTEVLTTAVSQSEDYLLYDFRANDQIAVWVESKLSTSDWRLYTAAVGSDHTLGTPVLVDQGNEDYDPPLMCVSGTQVFYTRLPYESGTKSSEDSYLMCVSLGSADATIVYTSSGRMITNPQATDGIVSFVPRVSTSGIYYQLSAINASTHELIAAEILPKTLKVNDALYLDGKFIFGIEQTYTTGAGLANYGTYRAIDGSNYMRLNKTPSDTPALMGDFIYIKSSRGIVGVEPTSREYFVIDVISGCADYGDYLATTGTSDRIVTFTTIATGDGSGNGVTRVRVFKSF
jgi:hypothetical protein